MSSWPFQIPGSKSYQPDDADRLVAKYQRWVILSLLAGVLLGAVSLILVFELIGPPTELWQSVIYLISIPVNTVMIVSAFMLSKQFYGDVASIIYAISMSIPFVALLMLLIINHKATKHLTSRGIKVGLLGVKPSQIRG